MAEEMTLITGDEPGLPEEFAKVRAQGRFAAIAVSEEVYQQIRALPSDVKTRIGEILHQHLVALVGTGDIQVRCPQCGAPTELGSLLMQTDRFEPVGQLVKCTRCNWERFIRYG